MKLQGKIGFLGGGRMAEALIKGILGAGLIDPMMVVVVDPVEERRRLLAEQFKVTVSLDPNEVTSCATVILAVKPQVLSGLLADNRDLFTAEHLVISIAAGVSLKTLESLLAGTGSRVIRMMPNTPALVLEGAAALSAGARATKNDIDTTVAIFEAVGRCVILSEKEMDAVTGLSGSGPAYVFSFIEALIDAGVKVGLSRPVAETLALQTVLGSVRLAMESREHPAQLRAMVTSPGGTTIAGLHVMERAGFQGIIMDAVEAATSRSRELGIEAAKADS
ncbi:MAG: pyrroline-5-carboxylate reductase [Proteobacteria bacterium]|nr:pyrroline-5-carboxylate reductase [Pseudomonadota bacterium]MBU1688618.1 pyrroline-5-carboxylate reductase [Pseudomonadota bacterium]